MSKRPGTADPDQSATESADGDPFLSRWARRKRVARSGVDPDVDVGDSSREGAELANAAPADATLPEVGEDGQPAELADEDMPPVDSIDEDTDMSGFFSPKVSQAVKKAALRKFFHSPLFNIVDGLDDYDEDFRNFEALGDIITSDMRGQMERQAERAREAAAKDDGNAEPPAESLADEVAEVDGVDKAEDVAEVDAANEPTEAADHDSPPEPLAAAEPGVAREPGAKRRAGHGKLRPKGGADDDQ